MNPKANIVIIASLLVPSACVAQTEEEVLELDDRAYIMESGIWTEPVVDVCWDNPTSDNAEYRELVRNRVRQTWESASALEFQGWDECTSGSTGIRITWSDETPHVGMWDGVHDPDEDVVEMVLNHDYVDSGFSDCTIFSEACLTAHAVHEFGHAIGFKHEHDRHDSTCDGNDGAGDWTEHGDYDEDSVMNYCNLDRFLNGGDLSPGDIAAVVDMYGPNPNQRRLADFDGDGFGDLVVGAPGENGAAGAVGVLYGNDDGVSSADDLWMQGSDNVNGAPEGGDSFGRALAVGDYNGDGRSDLVIGTPGEALGSKNNAGLINVLYGESGGLDSPGESWTQDSSGIPGGAEAGDRMSHAVTAGDFNGDGYDDVALGTPGENSDAGAVVIIYGSAGGLDSAGAQLWMQEDTNTGCNEESGDLFGNALAAGDFDGDGIDDLAIGSPGEDLGSKGDAGSVIVLYGTSSGLDDAGSDYWDQDEPGVKGTAEAGDKFGRALAAGDFDGDGFDDLAVGVPEENDGAGYVNVLFGGGSGLTAYGDQLMGQDGPLTGSGEDDDHFGASLVAGDFDRDGFADLVIGVPDEGIDMVIPFNGAGALHVVFGSESGLDEDREQFWYQDADIEAAALEAGDHFGHALAVNDYDGDSFLDLAVGSPGEDDGSGLVIVLYGDEDGLRKTGEQLWDQDTGGIKGGAEDGDAFGFALR